MWQVSIVHTYILTSNTIASMYKHVCCAVRVHMAVHLYASCNKLEHVM